MRKTFENNEKQKKIDQNSITTKKMTNNMENPDGTFGHHHISKKMIAGN